MPHRQATPPRPRGNPSPTEYALVVIVCGIVGLMAVPRMPTPAPVPLAGLARVHQVQDTLEELRDAVYSYRLEHGVFPGYGAIGPGRLARAGATEDRFQVQLEGWSDVAGNASRKWNKKLTLGPYLVWGIPKNPVNGLSSVRVLADNEPFPDYADNETGWIYQPSTGEVRANCGGAVPGFDVLLYDL